MTRLLKRILSSAVIGILRLANGPGASLSRFWAFVSLASKLRTPLDPSVVILGVPEVRGSANIAFGRNLYLYRGLYLETEDSGSIQIGDNVVISRGTHIVSYYGIQVGDGVMIGEYVSIRDANHIIGHEDIRNSGHTGAPIVICRNAWIGRGAVILAGVTIGENSVVAANAVVTRDVPANTVVAGVPARPLSRERAA